MSDQVFFLLAFVVAVFVVACVVRSVLHGIIGAILWFADVRYTAKANAAARRARQLYADSRVTGWSGVRRG